MLFFLRKKKKNQSSPFILCLFESQTQKVWKNPVGKLPEIQSEKKENEKNTHTQQPPPALLRLLLVFTLAMEWNKTSAAVLKCLRVPFWL